MGALDEGTTFLLSPSYSARQGIGLLRARCSLGESFAPCLGPFCSSIPCPAISQSGIFSLCYHFSRLWLWHFLPLSLSFLWGSLSVSLNLHLVLSATSLFSFFCVFIVLHPVSPLVVSALQLVDWLAARSLAWPTEPYGDPAGRQVETATPLLLK